MNIQSFQRYIIWAALAAVSYLILLQWNSDYGSSKVIAAQQNTPQAEIVTNEFPTINQQQDSQNKTISEDIPRIVTTEEEVPSVKSLASTENSNFVRITTDVLDMYVDLKGGDIVKVNLLKHLVDINQPDIPLTLLQKDSARTYIAQSGLVGSNGPDANVKGRPLYQVEKLHYELGDEGILSVPLVYTDINGVLITKEFNFRKDDYLVDINYHIDNKSSSSWAANLFAQIKRDNTIDPYADTSMFAMVPFMGIAWWSPEKKYNKVSLSDIKEEPVKLDVNGGWLSFVQHYFISAWVAPKDTKNTFESRVLNNGENIFSFTTSAVKVAPGEKNTVSVGFYAGPKDQNTLAEIASGLDLTVDYGWLWMVAQLLYLVLTNIQSVVGNWGWSIVLLTVAVKAVFFPLNQYAFKSMANMKKLQPEMTRLKELYGEDKQKLSQATMEMYRKEKINPLGSCLPMLVQMPVFIALYWTLSEAVEIRHSPFIFYITDLSQKDPYFVLPALMAFTMWLQQKISPMVFQDPMQERVMKMMPIMFSIFFLFFPAGLVLYWLANNVLTISQQWVINKSIEKAEKK